MAMSQSEIRYNNHWKYTRKYKEKNRMTIIWRRIILKTRKIVNNDSKNDRTTKEQQKMIRIRSTLMEQENQEQAAAASQGGNSPEQEDTPSLLPHVNYHLYNDHVDRLATNDEYAMLLLEEIDKAERNPDQGLPFA
eukprot:scaffold27141_cov56-Attheya_sp.AAC.1